MEMGFSLSHHSTQMNRTHTYNVAVIGGGLAGLATAIQLAKLSFSVVLFEKEKYPFHKVCGEYISFESWPFLQSLGLPLQEWKLPEITQLEVSAPNGNLLKHALPQGGFGISRYKIDHALMLIAKENEVTICDGTAVRDVRFVNNTFHITTDKGDFIASTCLGAFGKRSNIDVKWNRDFVKEKASALNHFIAVKYHAVLDHPKDTIALHNFKNGYCGISPVEENKICICYLTTADNLRQSDKSIPVMEKKVIRKNPHLNKVFDEASFLYDKPLSIAQVSFERKSQVEQHMLLLGDAAGLIAPLCGNGMSMALHSSKIAAELTGLFLRKQIDRNEMEARYVMQWNDVFHKRLRMGRVIQSLFGNMWLSNVFIHSMKLFPSVADKLIRQTHGAAF